MEFGPEEITRGIRSNEFFLEYMPIVSLHTGQCLAAEALVRWNRNGELVPPNRFIPELEETPGIGLLTYWVIETIVKELGFFMEAHPDLHISLNVPPELFGRGGLVYSAHASHAERLFSQIVLELTERGTPDKMSIEGIRYARRMGLGIAVDDVEEGDLSLLLLARSRVDYLKLDRSLMKQLVVRPDLGSRSQELAAVLAAGAPLVVAEGIETEAEFDTMRALGVQLGQGWYFSKSLKVQEFLAYFEGHGHH